MDLVRARLQSELPQVSAYFQTGGLVDADPQLRACPRRWTFRSAAWTWTAAHDIADRDRPTSAGALPGVSDVLVPQDVDYPALQIDIDRERASELGLSAKEVVDSLITALTSDGMIAPSYWIDPKSGNDYLLTVQYPEDFVKNLADLGSMPLRARASASSRPGWTRSVHITAHQLAHRGGPLPDPARRWTSMSRPPARTSAKFMPGVQKIVDQTEAAAKRPHHRARLGAGDARLLPELRPRTDSVDGAGLFDPGRAVQIVPRSVPDSAGRADRA